MQLWALRPGTAMVTDLATLDDRARTQGTVDLGVALAGATGGLASGAVLASVTPGANWWMLWRRDAGARQWAINLGGLASRTTDVSIAGSGNVRANASESANVSIMGSGDVDISGGAKCKVSKAGSGNVRCG